MFKILLLPVGLAIALFGAGLTLGAGPRDAVRSDCPGKIVCPKTGREICKDKCPLNDEARADRVDREIHPRAEKAFAEISVPMNERSDCPGKIICPKTGREICKDKCPLNDENKDKDATPPCCK